MVRPRLLAVAVLGAAAWRRGVDASEPRRAMPSPRSRLRRASSSVSHSRVSLPVGRYGGQRKETCCGSISAARRTREPSGRRDADSFSQRLRVGQALQLGADVGWSAPFALAR